MRNEKLEMRNWACAEKARKFFIFPFSLFPLLTFSFSFLIFPFLFSLFPPFHFSFVICHLSFVIFKSLSFLNLSHFSFVICHFLIREREGDPCIDAQQDDEQGLDGVDNQYEEQRIV